MVKLQCTTVQAPRLRRRRELTILEKNRMYRIRAYGFTVLFISDSNESKLSNPSTDDSTNDAVPRAKRWENMVIRGIELEKSFL
jgi:hypothetical protein